MVKEKQKDNDNGGEICSLRDEGSGIVAELKSAVMPISQLLKLTQEGFNFLESKRQNKNKMVGVD